MAKTNSTPRRNRDEQNGERGQQSRPEWRDETRGAANDANQHPDDRGAGRRGEADQDFYGSANYGGDFDHDYFGSRNYDRRGHADDTYSGVENYERDGQSDYYGTRHRYYGRGYEENDDRGYTNRGYAGNNEEMARRDSREYDRNAQTPDRNSRRPYNPDYFGTTEYEPRDQAQSRPHSQPRDTDPDYYGGGQSPMNREYGQNARPYQGISGHGQQGQHYGKGPQGYQRSDERILEDVSERLMWHGGIDASQISIRVEGGEVTLEGTVTDRSAKRMAEDLLEDVRGLKEVHNHLRIQREGQNTQSEQAGG